MTSFGQNGPSGVIASRGPNHPPPQVMGTKFYPVIDRVNIVYFNPISHGGGGHMALAVDTLLENSKFCDLWLNLVMHVSCFLKKCDISMIQ